VVGGAYTIVEVDPAGPSTDLQPGDRIVSAADDPYAGSFGPALALSRVPYGGFYVLHLLRGNVPRTVILPMMPAGSPTLNEYLPSLIVAFLLFMAAAYIAALRWGDLTARLAAISFLFAVFAMLSVTLSQFPGWNRPTSAFAIVLAGLYRPWELPLTYHFCSRFPQPLRETAAGNGLRWALYAVAALLWIPLNVPVLAHVLGATPGPVFRALLPFGLDGQPGALMIAAFESIAGVLTCLVLVRNYRRLGDPDSRRKIRWAGLAFGTSVGAFVTFAVLKVAWYATGSVSLLHLALFVNNSSILVIGLSFIGLAYAVARHRVLGIHVVLRRGLQYLLARNVLRLVVFLPLLIVLFQAIVTDRGLKDLLLRSTWPFYLALAVTGAISLRYRRQMQLWLDRKFFRGALAQEQMLAALIERLKNVESEEELCLITGSQLTKALHVDGCHVLLRDEEGRMRVAYSQLPDRAARLRRWMNDQGRELIHSASVFQLYEVQDTVASEAAFETEPTEHLIVPVTGADPRGIGALVLGPKRSEQPYTSRDRNLLKAIAGQMAIMHEVLCLKQRVAQERRVRVQVLGHLDQQRVQLLNECPDCGRCYTTAESVCVNDGASLSLTLPVERTIDGKYRLERRIGRGGMGVVYRGRDVRLERAVAIKIMTGDLFGNSAAMSRFEREARAAAVIKHPNIVAVYDFGRLPTGGAYLVMELIDGRSWREYLKLGRGLSERTSGWMTQLCLALEAAHARGVIHRDLKPENIMIANEGSSQRVIVLDFGLAKVSAELSPSDGDLTITGAVMGTRGYMSPEQRSGKKVDLRTDVFSVGVICAETVTGRRPPRTGASLDWLKASLNSTSLNSTTLTHVQLSRLLQRAMARKPGQRPSMREFREALGGVMSACISEFPAAADEAGNMDTLTMPPGNAGDR
jgi:eukaryotic-like serine/threonine-protein kinase